MTWTRCRIAVLTVTALWFAPAHALAQIVTGSDGSDGAFVFVPDAVGGDTMTIDLALAASGLDGQGQPITWQTPSPVAGRGVYDPFAWSIVFKYSALSIAAGQTVQFRNHPSRAPVVWLIQGNASIAGTVSLTPTPTPFGWSEPAPGGFRGAQRGPIPGTSLCGFGPSGGWASVPNANYGGLASAAIMPPYGSPSVFPLVGGSGSAAWIDNPYGVNGGGAILVAAGQTLELTATGSIRALGSTFANLVFSSGGGIRLVADVYAQHPTAVVLARGTLIDGQCTGRVRIEANSMPGARLTSPPASLGTPGPLLPDASTPTVRVASLVLGGQTHPVPADPRADFSPPEADIQVDTSGDAVLTLEARNVAPGRTCEVRVGGVPGTARFFTSSPLAGTEALSTATVTVPMALGLYCVQVRVVL